MFVRDLKFFQQNVFKQISICNGLIHKENEKNDPTPHSPSLDTCRKGDEIGGAMGTEEKEEALELEM